MFCPKCGATNDDSSKFCLSCGGPLGEQPAAPTPPVQPPVQNFYQPPPPAAPAKKSHTGLIVVIVLILVLVIGAAAVFFVMSNKNDKNDKDSTTKATTSAQSATTKASTTNDASASQTTSYYSNPFYTATWPESPLLVDVPKPAYGTIFTTDVSDTEVVITYSGWGNEQFVDYIGIVKAAGFDKDVSQANVLGASTYSANNGSVSISVATYMGLYAITVEKM